MIDDTQATSIRVELLKPATSDHTVGDLNRLCDDLERAGLAVERGFYDAEVKTRGLTWVEVVVIYVGTKGVELLVEESLKQVARTISAPVRSWLASRPAGEVGTKRREIRIVDSNGNLLETIIETTEDATKRDGGPT